MLRLLVAIALAITCFTPAQPTTNPFAWPPATNTSHPWTRWWWLGNAIDNPNLTRQLELFHAAGIGGVEITCIYGVKGQDAREIPYLSPPWIDMLTHTCSEAHRLGIQVDLPPGSGWCIGGPQAPLDFASGHA